MYDDGFPWIKFAIIAVPLVIVMLVWSPGFKWKLINSVGVLIGAAFALGGKSINLHGRRR